MKFRREKRLKQGQRALRIQYFAQLGLAYAENCAILGTFSPQSSPATPVPALQKKESIN